MAIATQGTASNFAEAVNRLDLAQTGNAASIQDLASCGDKKEKDQGAIEGGEEESKSAFESLKEKVKK